MTSISVQIIKEYTIIFVLGPRQDSLCLGKTKTEPRQDKLCLGKTKTGHVLVLSCLGVRPVLLVLSWFRNDGNFLSCLGFLVLGENL